MREVDAQTIESKKVKGYILPGEILDVDGICGGYNSSGRGAAAAGKCAGRSQINDTSKSGKTAGQPVSNPDLRKKTAKMMGVSADQIQSVELVRQSLDARKKPDLYYLYALDVAVAGKEAAIVKRARSVNVQIRKEEAYRLPDPGIEPLRERPVIVGFGPAGMFCGLMLARAGYRPLILERGLDADSRAKAVARYWTDGTLDPECNVQFGEGGAGTFSDGKLNTLVKDPSGRNKEVLKILAQAGADPANKPSVMLPGCSADGGKEYSK